MQLIETCIVKDDVLGMIIKIRSRINLDSLEESCVTGDVPDLTTPEHVYMLTFICAVPTRHAEIVEYGGLITGHNRQAEVEVRYDVVSNCVIIWIIEETECERQQQRQKDVHVLNLYSK